MKISTETVNKIAHLAKLRLTDEEAKRLTFEMEQIVGFADKLNELEIEGVLSTTHAVSVQNILRNDVLKPSYSRDKILSNAALRDDACFLVPKVVE